MSIAVTSLILSRKVGGPTRKIILLMLGDCANDDGSGIWPSKSTIAAKTEVHRDTVKKHIREMCKDGLLVKVGRRPCSNGYTTEYSLDVAKLFSFPTTGGILHPVGGESPGGGDTDPEDMGADDTPNHNKPSITHPSAEEVFEKLWKEVLAITPNEIKGRHAKKPCLAKFKKISSRKREPIAASRIAHAVLWYYDQDPQKKDDRRFMKGLGPVLNGEAFANYLDKGPFKIRTEEDAEVEAWKFRIDYVNQNGGTWPPGSPSPRHIPRELRDLVEERYRGPLFGKTSQGGL